MIFTKTYFFKTSVPKQVHRPFFLKTLQKLTFVKSRSEVASLPESMDLKPILSESEVLLSIDVREYTKLVTAFRNKVKNKFPLVKIPNVRGPRAKYY